MATTASDVYWSQGQANILIYDPSRSFPPKDLLVSFTCTPEPPHELDVIQRMSEAYRELGL